MKTLDEVIILMEDERRCDVPMYKEDALYYLKMYRSDMQMYAENQKYWEDELRQKIKDFVDAKERYIKRLKDLDIGTVNNPLTWDELKTLKGKPVWIELLGKGHWKGWDVIGGFYTDDFGDAMCTARLDDYYLNDLDKTWQAYRKERS